MKLVRTESKGVRILSCSGEMKRGGGDESLVAACVEALDAGSRRLVLDLTRLAYLDSAGIGAVVQCSKRAAERAAIMKLVLAPEGPVRKIFWVTHVDQAFDVYETVDEALASFAR